MIVQGYMRLLHEMQQAEREGREDDAEAIRDEMDVIWVESGPIIRAAIKDAIRQDSE